MKEAKACAEELKSACFQMPGCRAIPMEEVFVEIITKHIAIAVSQSEKRLAECLEALRIMVRTYPYHPPCFNWEQQVYAHGKAKAVLAKSKEQ